MIDRKGFIKRRFGVDEPEIARIAEFKRQIIETSLALERAEGFIKQKELEISLAAENADKLHATLKWKEETIAQLNSVVMQQAQAIESYVSIIQEQRGWRYCAKRLWHLFKY